MAYDAALADRVRALLPRDVTITEKAMFGGLAFLVDGNMSVTVSSQGGLLVRVPPAEMGALAGKPHVDLFIMRGRPMEGWLRVGADGVKTARALAAWVATSVAWARTLPPKAAVPAKKISRGSGPRSR